VLQYDEGLDGRASPFGCTIYGNNREASTDEEVGLTDHTWRRSHGAVLDWRWSESYRYRYIEHRAPKSADCVATGREESGRQHVFVCFAKG